MFEFRPTKKGLLRAEFQDRFGAVCSVQESSFVEEDCIWLGVEVDIHGTEQAHGRMHITQAMAKQLIPMLRHFARTGKLGVDAAEQRYQIGAWVRGVGPTNFNVRGRVVGTNSVHLTIQDSSKEGAEGQHLVVWEQVDLEWEQVDPPDRLVSRYDLINAQDDDAL